MAILTNAIGQHKQPMVDITEKNFLTVKEAAALSGLSVSHFEFASKNRKLKAHIILHVRGRRIKRSELDVYVKKL
jgi:excisionase family DNA binding protein